MAASAAVPSEKDTVITENEAANGNETMDAKDEYVFDKDIVGVEGEGPSDVKATSTEDQSAVSSDVVIGHDQIDTNTPGAKNHGATDLAMGAEEDVNTNLDIATTEGHTASSLEITETDSRFISNAKTHDASGLGVGVEKDIKTSVENTTTEDHAASGLEITETDSQFPLSAKTLDASDLDMGVEKDTNTHFDTAPSEDHNAADLEIRETDNQFISTAKNHDASDFDMGAENEANTNMDIGAENNANTNVDMGAENDANTNVGMGAEKKANGSMDMGAENKANTGMDMGAENEANTKMDMGAVNEVNTPMDMGAEHDASTRMNMDAVNEATTTMDMGAEHDANTSMDTGAEHDINTNLVMAAIEDHSASGLEITTTGNQFISHLDNLSVENHVSSNMELVSTEHEALPGDDMLNIETPGPTRRRRKKSMVWEHFTIENGTDGSMRACCKRCNQTFAYSTGSKLAGTSHLKRHIALDTCLKNVDKPRVKRRRRSQSTPNSTPPKLEIGTPNVDGETPETTIKRRRRRRFSNSNIVFDQDRSLQDLVKMIILHEYPLHIVEHPAFMTFVQNLQPRFQIADFSSVEEQCFSMYQKEKQNIFQLLGTVSGRICLSLDLYMSSQTFGCICLTGHFVGVDWKPQKRVLNFTLVPFPHTGDAHAGAIARCLAEWNIENRLFAITLDHSASNDNVSAYLRDHHSNSNNGLGLNGRIFVVRCFSHILNIIAQNGLEAIHEIVYKVRESLKYVKACQEHEELFAKVVQGLQVTSTKALCIDVQNQWNTTYHMLLNAVDYKQAFAHLETCDCNYNDAPSPDEWNKVEVLCRYLKLLYDGANYFTGVVPYPTSSMYFHEAWKIQLELTNAASSDDPLIASITKQMQEKFGKYWSDCNLILAVAVVVDPRFKMKLVEFCYSKIYGDNAEQYLKAVDDSIHDLYCEYVAQPLPLTPAYEEQNSLDIDVKEGGTLLISDDGLLDFDVYISELASSQQTKSELDQYLEESLLPRIQDFDVLNWWKLNRLKYPTLSNMARDILAIPMSTVGTEYMFTTSKKELDDYRSSLRPETAEALVCAKDWLQYQQQPQQQEFVEPSNALVKMEH